MHGTNGAFMQSEHGVLISRLKERGTSCVGKLMWTVPKGWLMQALSRSVGFLWTRDLTRKLKNTNIVSCFLPTDVSGEVTPVSHAHGNISRLRNKSELSVSILFVMRWPSDTIRLKSTLTFEWMKCASSFCGHTISWILRGKLRGTAVRASYCKLCTHAWLPVGCWYVSACLHLSGVSHFVSLILRTWHQSVTGRPHMLFDGMKLGTPECFW